MEKHKEPVEEKCIIRGIDCDRRDPFYIRSHRAIAAEFFMLSEENYAPVRSRELVNC